MGNKHSANRSSEALSPPLGMSRAAFSRFDRWMDAQLARLEKKWRHAAAPNAARAAASARLNIAPRPSQP